jgi:hypothetical protein
MTNKDKCGRSFGSLPSGPEGVELVVLEGAEVGFGGGRG